MSVSQLYQYKKKQVKKVKTSDITRTVSTKRRIEFAAPRLIKSTECQFHALFNEQANKNIPRELINSTQYPVLLNPSDLYSIFRTIATVLFVSVLLVGSRSERTRNQRNAIYYTFAKNIESRCHCYSTTARIVFRVNFSHRV